jgi:hypothetical protein
MRRVTRPGGAVALCMWDLAGDGMGMLAAYWAAARQVDPSAPGERLLPGAAEGDIADRLGRAGLRDVAGGALPARVEYSGFEDLWVPFTAGIGPAGQHLASLPPDQRAEVRSACRAALPEGPFALTATAWWARGTVP